MLVFEVLVLVFEGGTFVLDTEGALVVVDTTCGSVLSILVVVSTAPGGGSVKGGVIFTCSVDFSFSVVVVCTCLLVVFSVSFVVCFCVVVVASCFVVVASCFGNVSICGPVVVCPAA